MGQKASRIENEVEVVIRFKVETPIICTTESAAEAGKTAARLIRENIGEALSVLKDHYDVEVLGRSVKNG